MILYSHGNWLSSPLMLECNTLRDSIQEVDIKWGRNKTKLELTRIDLNVCLFGFCFSFSFFLILALWVSWRSKGLLPRTKQVYLVIESKIPKKDPGEGTVVAGLVLPPTNQQTINHMSELPSGCCCICTLQIWHCLCGPATLTKNIQGREYWEMQFCLTKLTHYEATTDAIK